VKTLRRAIGALLLLCAALLMRPAIAWAHAHLKKAEPAAGSSTSTPPHVIRLWFSEKPELSLTKVTLADSAGALVTLGAPAPDAEGLLAVSIPIPGVLGAGLYTVSWSTAASDGHPAKGHFSFRVTAPPATVPSATPPAAPSPIVRGAIPDAPVPAATNLEDTAASASTPAFVVARAISFAAVLAMIGAVAFRLGIMSRMKELDAATESAIATRIASLSAVAAGVFVLATLARLFLQNRMMSGDAASDLAHLQAMSMETNCGAAWRPQLAAGVVAFFGFLLVRRMSTMGWMVVGAVMVTLAAVTAAAGHAGASPQMPALATVVDTFHIIGAAGWMGSLLWMVVAGLPIIQSSADGRATRAAALVHAFSPAALAFGAVVGATGVVSATLKFDALSALWTTSYGQVLLVKLALLVALAALGYHNWRRVRPSLGTDEGTARLERSASIEVGIGMLVVIVTAILVATPTPT
jgi:copper transport protein